MFGIDRIGDYIEMNYEWSAYPIYMKVLDYADNPEWELAGKVHDWRNHIGFETVQMWGTFTKDQKAALIMDAMELASHEEWD